MKRRILPLILILALAISLIPSAALADTEHWAADYIADAQSRGWLGDAADPDAPVTRGEFAAMLWLALGSPAPEGESPFDDADGDAITALYEAQIVNGYGDGIFAPTDLLNREMALVMLARAFGLAPESGEQARVYEQYSDAEQISAWARDAVSILTVLGYAEGDGVSLMPQKSLTLGELVKLLIVVVDGEAPEPEPEPEPEEPKADNSITYTVPLPARTYTVTYDANGGTGEPVDSASYQSGDTVTAAPATTPPANRSFYRWNTAADGSGTFYKAGATFTITANITLYAIYTGDGTSGYPIEVRNAEDLSNIRNDLAKHYKLTADIDLEGNPWTPIGDLDHRFTGSFDGDGHSISGLYVDTGDYSAGLFGRIGTGSVVKNLALPAVSVKTTGGGGSCAGGVVGGNLGGTVQNCYVECTVIAGYSAGGVVGETFLLSPVTNCYALGTVTSTTYRAGGIAGYSSSSTVRNCVALNDSVCGATNVGRIVGQTDSTVTDCYARSDMTEYGGGDIRDGTDVVAGTNQDQYNNQYFWQMTLGWVFGGDEAAPWVWGSDDLPALWFVTPGN